MGFPQLERRSPYLRLLVLGGALLVLMGGCPIDTDALIADVVDAALESAADSFIESLSAYLAGS